MPPSVVDAEIVDDPTDSSTDVVHVGPADTGLPVTDLEGHEQRVTELREEIDASRRGRRDHQSPPRDALI
jgi:hypothetical protein